MAQPLQPNPSSQVVQDVCQHLAARFPEGRSKTWAQRTTWWRHGLLFATLLYIILQHFDTTSGIVLGLPGFRGLGTAWHRLALQSEQVLFVKVDVSCVHLRVSPIAPLTDGQGRVLQDIPTFELHHNRLWPPGGTDTDYSTINACGWYVPAQPHANLSTLMLT